MKSTIIILFGMVIIMTTPICSSPENSLSLEDAQELQFIESEIKAWHFHVYFFEVNNRSVNEMLTLRKDLRANIEHGKFRECSLNQIFVGWDGPHPVSQFEMCCNKTSFAVAHSHLTQNHGSLTVLVHPLTVFDVDDHKNRKSWLGPAILLDEECPCLYPRLRKARPCPVYPYYPDELPKSESDYFTPLPGTEDYKGLNKRFNIMRDGY